MLQIPLYSIKFVLLPGGWQMLCHFFKRVYTYNLLQSLFFINKRRSNTYHYNHYFFINKGSFTGCCRYLYTQLNSNCYPEVGKCFVIFLNEYILAIFSNHCFFINKRRSNTILGIFSSARNFRPYIFDNDKMSRYLHHSVELLPCKLS